MSLNSDSVNEPTQRSPSGPFTFPNVPGSATAEPPESDVLKVEELEVSYGQVQALRGIDVRIEEGEIVALIGPNGAGKTTLANTISGYLKYRGRLRYRDTEIAGREVSNLVADGLIHCTEKRDLFGYMDVDDNLRLGAYRRDVAVEEQLRYVYDLFPRLHERRDQNAHTMSGGEQQMLAIGRALMGAPDLLVLDEPTLGLAPIIIEAISDGLETIRSRGVTVLLTEQNVTFALKHADRIYLLENGTIEREGSPEELRGDDYVREVYLGG